MRHRFLRKSDLQACLELINPGFEVRPDVRARLPQIWGRLLDEERMIAHVIEDPAETGPRAFAAFGMSVFATDAFVDAYLSAPRPGLARLVYEEIADGRSPVLGVEGVRAAGAGDGLNLIVLHYVQRDWDLTRPKARETLYAGHASIRLAHEGYKVKRLLDEGFGVQRQIMEAGGLLLKHDFDAGAPGRPKRERSALYGLYREDVGDSLPGTTASFLFREAQPRFGFSPAEQRVLLRAVIEDGTDHEIAAELGISPDAVKRVWRRAYERVAAAEPALLAGAGAEPELTRGHEKRRHLLAYLRMHLEELRPISRAPGRSRRPAPAPPRAGGTSSRRSGARRRGP